MKEGQNKIRGQLSTELQSQRKQFNDFLEELPDALLEIDLIRQRLTQMNRQAQRLFGYMEKDVADGIEISKYNCYVKVTLKYG